MKTQEQANRMAAEMLAVMDTFPDALPGDEEGWTYTNAVYHAREVMKAAVRLYAKHAGDPKTFRPAKKLKQIKGSVRFYCIPNPAYLDSDD
jgi:hypothetical protein